MMGPITRERRRHVERMVRGEGVAKHPQLTYEAKLMFVAAGLRCDGVGHISKDALREALADPITLSVAANILTKFGCPPFKGALS